MAEKEVLLKVEDLYKHFPIHKGLFSGTHEKVHRHSDWSAKAAVENPLPEGLFYSCTGLPPGVSFLKGKIWQS